MKIKLTILLLCCHFLTKAQNIKTLEYFFDTDPGYGNGTTITLNTPELDSAFNFAIPGLSTGLHTVYVRLKNSANEWSHSFYREDFMVWQGSNGTPKIQMLDYFIDSISNTVSIPLTPSSLLDTTISIHIPDNGADNRLLCLRLKDQTGQLGNFSIDSISLCNLYAPASSFRSVRFADAYSFIDESAYNPSKKIRWSVDNTEDSAFRNNKLFSYTFPAGYLGNKTIRQISGTGCRVDTSSLVISMEGIESVSPSAAVKGKDVTMQIAGGGLDTACQVYLQHGSKIVYPYEKASYINKVLFATFDFHDTTGGTEIFDLHVVYPSAVSVVRNDAITVYSQLNCSGGNLLRTNTGGAVMQDLFPPRPLACDIIDNNEPFLSVDLTGPDRLRVGPWVNYTLNASNVSPVYAHCPAVWILIPSQYDAQFDVDWHVPYNVPADSVSADSAYIIIDTVINGQAFQGKLFGIVPQFLSPGETRAINFKLRTATPGHSEIQYWIERPIVGSPFTQKQIDCFLEAAGWGPSIISCPAGTYAWVQDKAGVKDFHPNLSQGRLNDFIRFQKNYWWSTAGTAVSCIPIVGDVAGKLKGAAKFAKAVEKVKPRVGQADKLINSKNTADGDKCGALKYVKKKIKDIENELGFDPNNLYGNSDYDTSLHYINNFSAQHYTVNFENLPAATANAQDVLVVDTLSADKFNFQTFKFTGYRIADSMYHLPQYREEVMQTVKIPGRTDMQVQFVGKFDTLTGIARCYFYSMDSLGQKQIPDSLLDGFLPPNSNGVSGTGAVLYEIQAKNLNTLDTFSNKAHIYFDFNAPIVTNNWMNTVDTTAPVSQVLSHFPVNDTTVRIVINHSDVGSGFAYDRFYYKKSTSSTFLYGGDVKNDTLTFIGDAGSAYNIYVRGVDNVGNEQHNIVITNITFSNILPLTWLSFTGRLINEKTELKWVTANEMNTSHFIVEKSVDGIRFSPIGTVAALGSTGHDNDYLFYDDNPNEGYSYYRLKQVDADAKSTYSSIVKIYFAKNSYVIIAPNPARDFVDIKSNSALSAIQVWDPMGKIVRQFKPSANNRYSLAGLSSGIYFIRIQGGNITQVFKLVVE